MTDYPDIERMLAACPFLRDKLEAENLDLPTVVMGGAASLIKDGSLSPDQQDQLFGFWNHMAETTDETGLGILATGALELFNDGPEFQRLARSKLTGKARELLEDMRLFWGQPDFGEA